MIRIDLGEDPFVREENEKKSFFASMPLLNRVNPKSFKFGIFSLIFILIASFAAYLPHHYLKQKKMKLTEAHRVEIEKLKKEIKGYNREIAVLVPFQKELKNYEKQKEVIQKKLSSVTQVAVVQSNVVPLLDVIGQSMNRESWLQEIQLNLSSRNEVRVKGKGLSNAAIADLVDRLDQSDAFSSIKLTYVNTGKGSQNKKIQSFELIAQPKSGS